MNLAVNIVDETAAGLLVGGAARAVGMMPVHQRIVKAHAASFGSRGFDVFGHQIPPRSLFRSRVVGQLGVEHTETFVMLGGHHHVFLAGLLGEFRPGPRGVRLRLESFGQLLVFGDRNRFVLHGPFVTPQSAVKAPVNEHAEARLVPPLHAALAIGVARRRVGNLNRAGQSRSRAKHLKIVPSSHGIRLLTGSVYPNLAPARRAVQEVVTAMRMHSL